MAVTTASTITAIMSSSSLEPRLMIASLSPTDRADCTSIYEGCPCGLQTWAAP